MHSCLTPDEDLEYFKKEVHVVNEKYSHTVEKF